MKMFHLKIRMLLTLVISGAVSATFANTIVLNQNAYSYGQGGEFSAVTSQNFLNNYVSLTIVNGGFETFCIESSVEFTPGTLYSYNLGLSDATSPGIQLTTGTAYLYYEFAKGSLFGYNYTDTASRVADAGLLQAAIWYLQGKQIYNADGSLHNNPATDGNIFYNQVISMFGSSATNASNGAYGVQVLQLWAGNGGPAQNQLVLTSIPDGGRTAMLLGLSCAGMLLVRFKSRRSDS